MPFSTRNLEDSYEITSGAFRSWFRWYFFFGAALENKFTACDGKYSKNKQSQL